MVMIYITRWSLWCNHSRWTRRSRPQEMEILTSVDSLWSIGGTQMYICASVLTKMSMFCHKVTQNRSVPVFLLPHNVTTGKHWQQRQMHYEDSKHSRTCLFLYMWVILIRQLYHYLYCSTSLSSGLTRIWDKWVTFMGSTNSKANLCVCVCLCVCSPERLCICTKLDQKMLWFTWEKIASVERLHPTRQTKNSTWGNVEVWRRGFEE